jgi:DNA-directed RNA polymerase specialized sigma24 family protein
LDQTEGQHHSSAEAKGAIDGLPAVYWLRLRRWAIRRLKDNAEASADDVIATMYERFLDGDRHWRVGVPITACFWNAVKSEINNAWDKHKLKAKRELPVTVGADGQAVDPVEQIVGDLPDPAAAALQAEEQRRLQAIADHIENSFKDDDAVTAVIIGRIEKMSPEDVQRGFDLSATQFESACKKLRRFLNKNYRDGWKSHEQQQPRSEGPSR